MTTVSATTKGARVSTRKVRLVADAIRHMTPREAVSALMLINKRGAAVLIKTIRSAVANAVNNGKLEEENLVIDRLEVQEGQFLKRFHASTRGRVHPYKKRSTHVTVVLKAKDEKKPAAEIKEPEAKTEKTEVKKETKKKKNGKKS